METALGQRLSNIHIQPDPDNRRGIYHVEAWSYIDAASAIDACVFVLKQVSKVAEPILQPWSLTADNCDDQLISYYWDVAEQFSMHKIISSGVRLVCWHQAERSVEELEEPLELWQEIGDIVHRSQIASAPRIELPAQQDHLQNFSIDFDVEIYSPTKAKLLAVHLPEFCERRFQTDVEVVEIATRSLEKGPFKIRLQQSVPQVTETAAIALCLRWYASARVTLNSDKDGKMISFSGETVNRRQGANGITTYTLRRKPP